MSACIPGSRPVVTRQEPTKEVQTIEAYAATFLEKYAAEHKHPLALGHPPAGTEVVTGEFWRSEIARHDRQRLSYAVWSVLSRRLLA